MVTPAERACVNVLKDYGYHVTPFSRGAKAQIRDLPDCYGQHPRGVRIWWDSKVGRDHLTRGQHAFLMRELNADGIAGCGDSTHLRSVLDLLTRNIGVPLARRRCRELVDCLAAKGFRWEKKER